MKSAEQSLPVHRRYGNFERNHLSLQYLDELTSCADEAQNENKAKVTGIRMQHRATANFRWASFLPKPVAKPKRRKAGLRRKFFIAADGRRE
jgi:hypothetical protein